MVGNNYSDKQAAISGGVLKYFDANNKNWIKDLEQTLILLQG